MGDLIFSFFRLTVIYIHISNINLDRGDTIGSILAKIGSFSENLPQNLVIHFNF
jgi:hypothetical protein